MAVDKYGNPIFTTQALPSAALPTLPTAAAATLPLQGLIDSLKAPTLATVPGGNSDILTLLLGALSNQGSKSKRAGGGVASAAARTGQQAFADSQAGHRAAQPLLTRGKYAVPAQGKVIGTPYSGTHTLGNWESDNAVDISLPTGTPLRAAANGTIGSSFGSLNSSNPRMQGLRLHLVTGGNEFYYAHLSSFAPGIKPGAKVKKGQIIGYSGSANGSAHLHLGVKNGDPRGLYK
jgi:murein DD-endopeptidase MepM/ murein hydrolase activator NlpD